MKCALDFFSKRERSRLFIIAVSIWFVSFPVFVFFFFCLSKKLLFLSICSSCFIHPEETALLPQDDPSYSYQQSFFFPRSKHKNVDLCFFLRLIHAQITRHQQKKKNNRLGGKLDLVKTNFKNEPSETSLF